MEEPKIKISADYREKELIYFLKNYTDVELTEFPLEVGDFIVSDRTVIERKTYQDFVASLFDGRLFDQAGRMKDSFSIVIIIIEGLSNERIDDNIIKAAIASLVLKFNISIISTKDKLATARMIYHLARKEQVETKRSISYKFAKVPTKMPRIQEQILSSIPGINSTISKRLLENFGSIEKVLTASEEDLKRAKGIGDMLSAKIKKILTEKYMP
jgi:ERCC4-type nuclease